MTPPLSLRFDTAQAVLTEVLARRYAGEPAHVIVDIEHPIAMRARQVWRDLQTFGGDRDERWQEIRTLRARPWEPIDAAVLETVRTVLLLADEAAFGSWAHVRGTEALLGCAIRNVRITVPARSERLPAARATGMRVAVVVPEGDPEARAFAEFALGDLHAPVGVVSPAQFAECADASVIVDADWSSPAIAIGAASSGIPVVVSSTSGAREVVQPAATYDPLYPESLADAVRIALGSAGSRAGTMNATREPRVRVDAAHVTFLVRTKDRPAFLRRTLDVISRQRDAIVDAIVINDGGERVDEIVARYPFATLVHREKSDYVTAAPAALELARGTYVQLLDDDDALFPDHAACLSGALERSGANIAYSDSLNIYVDGADPPRVTGYRVLSQDYVDRDRLLVTNPIMGSPRVLYRRSAFVALGGFRPLALALDYDAYLRMSRSNDFIYVPVVTAIYSVFLDGRNRSVARGRDMHDAFERIFAAVPAAGRPLIERRRRAVLDEMRENNGLILKGAAVTLDAPLALW